ncbi:UDP-glucuronosyltransferase 1-6-like [Gigantopelta aegis]|uniref:UDP-glucuronosyltransferase 1-6-like n=1 Tax=Gigantopelta aegis TaxID=1735272 RepID=UPI001B88AC14|nr:UDP-glucuronosyltransferase 1-6-like [Gigantopelta aegis]
MNAQLFILILLVTSSVKAAKILLFPGMMAASVCNEMRGFGEELINRGHTVAFYLPNKFDYSFMSDTKIKILKHNFRDTDKKLLDDIFKGLTKNVFSGQGSLQMTAAATVMNTICDSVFADKDGLKMLKEQKFDIVVVEALVFTKCLMFLPRYLNVSYVGVGAGIDGRDGGLPFQGNTSPHLKTTFSDHMSFWQRLINVLSNVLQYVVRPRVISTTDPATYDQSLAGLDAEDLIRDAILYLENSDHVVDYPKALTPNFIQVGGLSAKPPGKLPKDLETFMTEATNGVVMVSFGSILREAPKEMMNKLMTAFSQLKQRVLFKTDRDFVEGNIKSVKWLPQNDVLGHPKVKLFFSHCGKNGFFEGVYHGVPIICTPLNGDAFPTASKVVNKQIGLSLDLNVVSASDIVKAVNTVLTNTTYRENMRRISKLLRDRPETPTARAASAIEHVLKYGGEHLRSPSRKLHWVSYVYADVWFIIFSTLVIVLYSSFHIAKFMCCRKKHLVQVVEKNKSD